MNSLSVLVEPPVNSPKSESNFRAQYSTSANGHILVHRQLVTQFLTDGKLGTIPMTVGKRTYEHGELKSFLLLPSTEEQEDGVLLRQHRGHLLVVLNQLFTREGLNYKQLHITLLVESVTDETKGLQITIVATKRRRLAQQLDCLNTQQPESLLVTNRDKEQPESVTTHISHEQRQMEVLMTTYFRWRASQQMETDETAFAQSFAQFCQKFNHALFRLAIPSSIAHCQQSPPEFVNLSA
jgi:hypothetical protein